MRPLDNRVVVAHGSRLKVGDEVGDAAEEGHREVVRLLGRMRVTVIVEVGANESTV